MKNYYRIIKWLAVLALSTFNNQLSTAYAQGTAFTYQGRLQNNGSPAQGIYDLRFSIYDSTNNPGNLVAGPVTNFAAAVNNGLFTVTLDFGSGVFTGDARWLEIAVRTNGGGVFTTLTPRQALLPVPYAIFAAGADSALFASSAGSVPGLVVQTNTHDTPNVFAGSSANGLAGDSVEGATIGGGGAPSSPNHVAGRFATVSGGLDNQAYVNATVGGGAGNYAFSVGCTVGGGETNTSGNMYSPWVSSRDATVAGGMGNAALAQGSTVGGGEGNTSGYIDESGIASGDDATVAGGTGNTASGYGSAVGGGEGNYASGGDSMVAGGWGNSASGAASSVIGGGNNWAATNYAVVAGGFGNVAGGQNSFAAGNNAQATNDGSFVWADAQDPAFGSTTNNQFNVRASGGVRLVTGGAGLSVDGVPVFTAGSGLRIQENTNGAPNLIFGSPVNFVGSGVIGATIGGGGATMFGGYAYTNSVTGALGTVGGGGGNIAGGTFATVAGGQNNTASGNAAAVGGGWGNIAGNYYSSVAGGVDNTAGGWEATVGGGFLNSASGSGATVAGGQNNTADYFATVSGGLQNTASGGYATVGGGTANAATNWFATVPGGYGNFAAGQSSFAAGCGANATNDGSFVWSDFQGTAFGSTTNNQFSVRAAGGVRLVTSGAGMSVDGIINGNGIGLTNLNAAQLTSIGNTNGGSGNFFVGPSGNSTTRGSDNTAHGFGALYSNTFGFDNTANGFGALYYNANGYANTANGFGALYYNGFVLNTTNGYANTANGAWALYSNTIGIYNTANGAWALYSGTSGYGNTANGFQALYSSTNGYANTANGAYALGNSTSGSYNIALGYQAGRNLSTGSSNIDIGNLGVASDNNIIRIGTSQTATYLVGTVYANGVALTSDRDAKEDFAPVNPQQVLAKVSSLPITEWNYKTDKSVGHIGPMAQDFHAAFGLNGADDKHISVVDEGGVALAAIQGLNQKLEETRAQNAALKHQNESLAERLNELEQAVNALAKRN